MVPQPSKQEMIMSYLRHNAEVEDYFKGTQKLLVMDMEAGDGWSELCDFLNIKAPAGPFPQRNRQRYQPDEAKQMKLQHRLDMVANVKNAATLQFPTNSGAPATRVLPAAHRSG